MPRIFPVFVSVLIIPVLTFSSALADVTVEYLGPLDPPPLLNEVPQGDFLLGHAGDPVHILTNPDLYPWYSRCSILEPIANGCTCSSGYTVNSYSLIFAKIGSEVLEPHLTMGLGNSYELDHYPPGTVCFNPPGLEWPPYQVPFYCTLEESFTVDNEGFYKVTLTGTGLCDCIFLDFTQALHVPYFWHEHWGSQLFLVADDNPGHCPDYTVNPNMGYLWYTEIDAPGNILMWADATCCENPVGTESDSWGSLKALFR